MDPDYHHQACVEFCSVTGLLIADGDLSLAQFYLEETGWNVNEAIKNYRRAQSDAQRFEDPNSATTAEASGTPPINDSSAASSSSKPATSGASPAVSTTASQKKFRLITWNIDGLDERDIRERTVAVHQTLELYAPDIVYLQEVISPTLALIESCMPGYRVFSASREQYFTAILIRKSSVQVESEKVDPFPGTCMLRALQTIQVKCAGVDLTLMCSHLESTKQHATERMNQLKIVLDHMIKAPTKSTVIFGGDTNLRDTEVTKIGGLPSNIFDIWQLCGEPKEAKFTWDLTQNTNLDWPYPNRPKCRFDRLYLRHCYSGMKVSAERFSLTGKKKLKCGRFPSDHWGIVVDFKVNE